jgi:Effector-associated domain 7
LEKKNLMAKLSRVLAQVELTETFTLEVQTQLIAKIGKLDSEIFATAKNFLEVAEIMTGLEIKMEETQLDTISMYLLVQMNKMKIFSSTDQAANPTSPIEVTVNQAKTPEQMDLEELLVAINKNPGNLRLRQALMLLPEVTLAQQKANNRPVFAGRSGLLNIDLVKYVLKWLRDGNPYREEFDGYYLTNLGDILDAGQTQFIHPINGSKLPTNMIDELGLDFSLIDETVYKAYVWFRQECNIGNGGAILSELQRMSSHAIYQDMLSKGKDSITQKILAKYAHACESKSGAMIRDISIEWPVESRNHAAYTSQFQDMSSHGDQNQGTKIIDGELTGKQLRQLMEQALSAENVNTIAFDYFNPVYRNFANGQTNSTRISEIIDHAQRHQKVSILMTAIWKINSRRYDYFMAELNPNQNSTTTVNQTGKYNVNIAHASGPGSVAIGGDLVMGDKIDGDKVIGTRITTGNGNISGNYNIVQIGNNNRFQ